MKLLLALLLLFKLSCFGQTINNRRVPNAEIYANAIENYLEYITQPENKSADTLFIEKIDSINFNLPNNIKATFIEALPVNTIMVRLKTKGNPIFLRLQSLSKTKHVTTITFSESSCNYLDSTTEIIDEAESYKITYANRKNNSLRFVEIKKVVTGCRRFYKFKNGQLHFYKSVCS